MTQQELTVLNLGNSLDDLANLDPRGYGVCKLLYKASREYTNFPLCVNSATKLSESIKKGDLVYILSGFVLHPFNKAETDGIISAVLLANALIKAFGARPAVVCPEEAVKAVKKISELIQISIDVITFTKDKSKAEECADAIIAQGIPKAVISIECPGENEIGIYHNAKGIDVTELEAKQDILFEKLRKMGVLNISIGDLGNEIGMGTIGEYIKSHIPYATEGMCSCGCGGGIAARTKADNIITATVSDWGCYSLIAMLAFIENNPDIMHDAKLQEQAMLTACENGLIDMSGKHIPAIDGFGTEITCSVVTLMKELVCSALNLKENCKTWFDKTIELNYTE